MKNISLKKLMLALLLTTAVPTLTAQVHVGDILCEGNAIISPANYPSSGATAIGVVFYVDNTGQHGWAVALEDAGNYAWGDAWDNTPLPDYSNQRQAVYDLDGYNNTSIIREYDTDYPAFFAVDFENGWYLPAIGQLNYLYANLIEVNASYAVVEGAVIAPGNWNYWSSTEYTACDAWFLEASGNLRASDSYGKYDRAYRVRAVRNF